MNEKMKEKIANVEHLNCAVCKKELTSINEDEVTDNEYIFDDAIESEMHFDISRSRKVFKLVENETEIEEDIEERNCKMHYQLCEVCFTKVLNESETLGKLFFVKRYNSFVY